MLKPWPHSFSAKAGSMPVLRGLRVVLGVAAGLATP
jgi:hypothetical protein